VSRCTPHTGSNFTVGISHQCQRVYIWTDVTPSRNPVKNGTFDLRKWRTKMILYLSVSWRCIFHDLQSHYLRLQSEVFNLCTTIVRDRAIYYYRQCRWVIITWRNLHLDRLHVRLFPGRNLKWYLFRERAPSRMKHNTLHFDVDWYVFFSWNSAKVNFILLNTFIEKKFSLIRSNSAIMHLHFSLYL
jgi:hypothetical protein